MNPLTGDTQVLNGFRMVPLDLIDFNPANIRDQLRDIETLAASILAKGMLQPMWVHQIGGGRFMLIAGHRRLAAARLAGLYQGPCQLMRPTDAAEALTLMLTENEQRVRLTPMERARAYRDLVRLYGSQKAAAEASGISQSNISQALGIFDLSPDELSALERGEMTMQEGKRRVFIKRGWKTKDTGWYFSITHPLATQVKASCDHIGVVVDGQSRRPVGGQGCGECWEATIRADERAKHGIRPLTHGEDHASTDPDHGLTQLD